MRVFAYIRYSSLNQKGNTSVETQRDAVYGFVKSTPELRGASIVERVDEAKSGTTVANRGALAAILRETSLGDAVVVFKYDRLGRNLLESLQTLRGLEDRGVRVYSTTEPNTEVVRNLLLTMAQEFSRQLGERCKRALDTRAHAGHVANKAAFGYRIERTTANGPGKFVVVPDQAAVVRQIFEWRTKGASYIQIVKRLNNQQCRSPKGILWRASTVRAILFNETYLGRVISGIRKFKKGHGLVAIRARHEWTVCEKAHDPIISDETWRAVRSFDCKPKEGRTATPRKQTKYLWAGFLKCHHCGANLMRSFSGKAYLGCEGGRKTGQSLACQCRYLLHEDEVTRTVFTLLLDQVYSPSFLKEFKKRVMSEIDRLTNSNGNAVAPLESAHKRLVQQIETASRRLVHLTDDVQATFLDELNKLKSERDSVKEQISQTKSLCATVPNTKDLSETIENRISKIRSAMDSEFDVAEAREILSQHVEKIEVATDGQAWLYPKPAGLLAGLVDVHQGNEYIPTGI
jgi:site-specific DNA recombinase